MSSAPPSEGNHRGQSLVAEPHGYLPLEYLRRRFTRVTSSVAYIPQLDGLRALALFMVLGHHIFALYVQATHRLGAQKLPDDWGLIFYRSPLVGWALNLAFGVSIFFAISGFVVSLPFVRAMQEGTRLPSTGLYLWRRLLRLEPPYFIHMILMFLWLVIWPTRPWFFSIAMVKVFGPHLLATLAYMHAQIFQGPSWINGIAWTLEIEIQFYLLMPLLAFLLRIPPLHLRRAMLAGSIAATALLGQYVLPGLHNPRLQYSILGHSEFFLAGILLADLYVAPPAWLWLKPRKADVCAFISGALVIYILHWREPLAWIQPFLLIVLYFSIFRGKWAGWFFQLPWLTIPGTMCYTVYLYHPFVLERMLPVTTRVFAPKHSLAFDLCIQSLVLVPVILAVSAVLYLVTERPFVLLSHRATRRWNAARTERMGGKPA